MDTEKRLYTRRTRRHSAKEAGLRKVRLNEPNIKALETPASGYVLIGDTDIPGFNLRVTAAGAKSFVLRYTVDGRARSTTIGTWPSWTAAAAREKAKQLRREAESGVDPLADKQDRRAAPTWADVVALYVSAECSKQRRGWEYQQILERETIPEWGRLKAADIRRRDVISLIERKAESAPVAANRLFEIIRRVCNFAVRREIIEVSPCLQVRKPTAESSKDRVLSRDEIRTLWAALEAGKHFTPQTAAALKLILLTAARPGEVSSMRWQDVNIKEATWTIPAISSKNATAHRAHLNAMALDILKALPKDSAFVFPSSTGKTAHIRPNTLSQAVRKAIQPKDDATTKRLKRAKDRAPLPIGAFCPHDLRRTAASMMASEGVPRFTIARVLNHSESGVTAIYDRYGHDREKREALDVWDRLLRSIIEGEAAGKVVSITGATA